MLVATDYQGLGAGGIHQYANAATNARDLINAARAVGSMGLSGSNRKVVAYGWSQGGGAVIAAASLKDYIAAKGTAFDGVDFVGFVALAPQDVEVLIPAGSGKRRGCRRKGDQRTRTILLRQRVQLHALRHGHVGDAGGLP